MFNTRERIERSLGVKLGLKANRSNSPKSAVSRRPFRPGMHGKNKRRSSSEMGQQLKEKQKIRFTYGISESTMKKVFQMASRSKGSTGEMIMSFLERRLDNFVFRSGFASSRAIARQLVSHGHVCVNGRKSNVSSMLIRVNDVITIRPESKKIAQLDNLVNDLKKVEAPVWVALDKEKIESKMVAMPKDFDNSFDVNMVVDFYAK